MAVAAVGREGGASLAPGPWGHRREHALHALPWPDGYHRSRCPGQTLLWMRRSLENVHMSGEIGLSPPWEGVRVRLLLFIITTSEPPLRPTKLKVSLRFSPTVRDCKGSLVLYFNYLKVELHCSETNIITLNAIFLHNVCALLFAFRSPYKLTLQHLHTRNIV